MKKRCKNCEHNCEGNYCFRCKPRTPLPKIARRIPREVPSENEQKEGKTMQEFFLSIWNKRPHRSEISGEWLGNEALSVFFHHIFEKNKYPQFKYDEDNIVLVTLTEHDNVGMNMYKYEEINKRRELLKIKYNL